MRELGRRDTEELMRLEESKRRRRAKIKAAISETWESSWYFLKWTIITVGILAAILGIIVLIDRAIEHHAYKLLVGGIAGVYILTVVGVNAAIQIYKYRRDY